MRDFTKGVICGVALILSGKIIYEIGKKKGQNTDEESEEIVIILTKENEEES